MAPVGFRSTPVAVLVLVLRIVATITFSVGNNIYSTDAFSNAFVGQARLQFGSSFASVSVSVSASSKSRSRSRNERISMFARSHPENNFDEEEENENENGDNENSDVFSCGMSKDPTMLDWDLQTLLSSDPSTEAMLIPLMNVYDAAANAAAAKATNDQADADATDATDIDADDTDNAPSHAPAIQPGKTSDPPAPVRSLDHNGPLPPSVAPYRMFVREYTRDMGHDGRFTVFADDGDGDANANAEEPKEKTQRSAAPSLQSDVVFSMDDPLEFIRDGLSYGARPDAKEGEAVVFIPGPHTVHDPSTTTTTTTSTSEHCGGVCADSNGEPRSSPDRLKYLSQVLDGIPMAQIHAGTHIDQGDLDVELTSDTINSLLSFELLTDAFHNNLSLLSMNGNLALPKKALYRLRARDLDVIHAILSRDGSVGSASASLSRSLGDKYLGSDSKGLKDTLIRLIDIAVRSVREEKSHSASGASSSSSSSPSPSSSSSSSSTLSSPSPHLVLMSYSATSNVLMSALSEWKHRVTTPIGESRQHLSDDESTNAYCRDGIGVGMDENGDGDNFERKVFSEEEAELLLHKALTVVTISALSRGFVDGPAYIHVSMNDDPLTSSLGITKSNPERGGKDAVILQAISPYLVEDDVEDDDESESESESNPATSNGRHNFIYQNDAHNIDSCVIQYLSLVRRINGVTSFREMYNLGIADSETTKLDISQSLFAIDYRSVGELIIPPHIDCELIPAMIRATGGERWLWNPDFQLGEGGVEGFDSPLPSLEYAQAEIENQLGYNTYDEIVENCCH